MPSHLNRETVLDELGYLLLHANGDYIPRAHGSSEAPANFCNLAQVDPTKMKPCKISSFGLML